MKIVALIKRALEHTLENVTRVDDDDDLELLGLLEVCTFQEAEVWFANPGLIIRLTDGSEYQLHLVRSRIPG
jgi:hypothetical protein